MATLARQQEQIFELTRTVNNQKNILDKISQQLEINTEDALLAEKITHYFVD